MDYPKILSVQIQSVLYHNDKASLLPAVAAAANAVRVYRQKTGMDLNVRLVYGDGSEEPVLDELTVQSIQKEYGAYLDFSYRVFGFNSGTAKGHNLMAEGFDGDFYMVMNPDVKVPPLYFVRMIAPFLEDRSVGMTEARQTPLEHKKAYNETTLETEWCSTACVMIRKQAFDSVHGFDSKSFFLYCDDVDFSWMLRLAGWKLLYMPSVPVYHAKTLSIDGKWLPTKAEIYYSAFASMMMAYKWSAPKQLKKLKKVFMNTQEPLHQKALADFLALTPDQLPKQLDPKHLVSHYVNGDFSRNRFEL